MHSIARAKNLEADALIVLWPVSSALARLGRAFQSIENRIYYDDLLYPGSG